MAAQILQESPRACAQLEGISGRHFDRFGYFFLGLRVLISSRGGHRLLQDRSSGGSQEVDVVAGTAATEEATEGIMRGALLFLMRMARNQTFFFFAEGSDLVLCNDFMCRRDHFLLCIRCLINDVGRCYNLIETVLTSGAFYCKCGRRTNQGAVTMDYCVF